jgi:hypothetical protein
MTTAQPKKHTIQPAIDSVIRWFTACGKVQKSKHDYNRQLLVLVEELMELTHAHAIWANDPSNEQTQENLLKEISDVQYCIVALEHFFGMNKKNAHFKIQSDIENLIASIHESTCDDKRLVGAFVGLLDRQKHAHEELFETEYGVSVIMDQAKTIAVIAPFSSHETAATAFCSQLSYQSWSKDKTQEPYTDFVACGYAMNACINAVALNNESKGNTIDATGKIIKPMGYAPPVLLPTFKQLAGLK